MGEGLGGETEQITMENHKFTKKQREKETLKKRNTENPEDKRWW